RTNASGWRSASRNSAVSYTRVSAAASRRASSSTTPSSRCAAAGLPSASATSDSAIALQAHGIGNRLEQIEDMLRDTREGVLVSEGDERGLARGEQLVRPRPLDTGETSLISLTHQHTLTRIPQHVLPVRSTA